MKSAVFVYDLTHLYYPETMTARNRWGMRLLFKGCLKRADLVLTCTERVRDEILKHTDLDKKKVEVVPLGVSQDFKLLPKEDKAPYILFTGTLEPRKNLPNLLKAMALLREGEKDLKLVITGGYGWKAKGLDGMISSLGLDEAVTLTGFVGHETLNRLYCGAALFVYPSLYEGFGLPLLEAMKCGTPVVTSKASCLPEVAGDAALLADPRDPRDMARAMGEVLRNSALAEELREKGKKRAEAFTWEKTASSVLDLLKR